MVIIRSAKVTQGLLQVGGWTCYWQQHSVKTALLRMLNDIWAGQNPPRVVAPLEEESYTRNLYLRLSRVECKSQTHKSLARIEKLQWAKEARLETLNMEKLGQVIKQISSHNRLELY